MEGWNAVDMPSQQGRLAVVTGATGGLGYETALALARKGAEVVVTGRDAEKGRVAVARIRGAIPAAMVRFEVLDLADLASVRAFAQRLLDERRAVDLLINNAGVMQLKQRRLTKDGFEMQFGTNHLGHFALTGLLLPLLRLAEGARVVNVSSSANRMAKMDFANLQGEKKYRPWGAYQQSKLANLLFTFELQRRSDALGWELMATAAHPGFARTDLIANGPGADGLMARFSGILGKFVSQSAADGALPTLFAATAPAAMPMGYYGPRDFMELKGPVVPAQVTKAAKSLEDARRLWSVSEELTGVRW